MLNIRHLPSQASGAVGSLRQLARRASVALAALLLALPLASPAHADSCPDLQAFYAEAANASADWLRLSRQLGQLMPRCLQNAEFFALYGAAQLNSGQTAAALESLERALLMDPDSGAAQIDYAEALFRQGQIFSAMDMNAQILARQDVPRPLAAELQDRQRQWRGLTRQRGLQAEVLFGHDSNLNRGPDSSRLTLTLSGEPVEFILSPEFRPISGLFSNLRLSAFYTRHEPGHSHNLLADLRGRVSEDSRSDLLQLDTRYVFADHQRDHSWLYGAALTHLEMGGEALFTGTEGSLRYVTRSENRCSPYFTLAGQHQYYHQQNGDLDAIESKVAGGLDCSGSRLGSVPLPGSNVFEQRLMAEFSLLNNFALQGSRPGGDRVGWQARLDWQLSLPRRAVFSTQLAHTRLHDRKGYSELLADGARRDLERSYVLLQYRKPVFTDTNLLFNVYHQRQRSNIELFSSRDTTVEAGLSVRF